MNFTITRLIPIALIVVLCDIGKVHAIAGKIVYSYGQVEATGADGTIRPLLRGDTIDTGDAVRTQNGRTQIRFTDGGFVALQPNTEYRLDEYNFQGAADGSERSFFHLIEGSIRLVTGLIGRSNKENFQLTTPVASIGIRGTSGKCSHTESGGTQLAGYGGIWNLTSGAFSGPVEPGQAYSCDGSTCAEIPGFGQRQETTSEGQEEEQEEEEEEEEQEEGEEEQADGESDNESDSEDQTENDEETQLAEGESDSEGQTENDEENTSLAGEQSEAEEGALLAESGSDDDKQDELLIGATQEEADSGFVANREDEGGESAFFEAIVNESDVGYGEPTEPAALEVVLEGSVDTLTTTTEENAFLAGEQTDATGQNELVSSGSNVGSVITVSTGQSIGVAGFLPVPTTANNVSTLVNFPITFSSSAGTLFFQDGKPIGGLAQDRLLGQEFLGIFVADFEAVRAGLVRLQAVNNSLASAGLNALGSVPGNLITQLSSNPAELVDLTVSPDGLLSFGRWQNGFVLDVEATFDGILRRSNLRELIGFQSEHVIAGANISFASNALARYDLTGGTRSTSTASSELGLGLTAGKILFDFSFGYGSIEATLSHVSDTHSLIGDLVLTGNTFLGPRGVATSASGNTHFVNFSGFFAGNGTGTPQAIGVNYGVFTQNPISGVAAFGLTSTGDVNLRDASPGSFVGISNAMTRTGQLISSDAYLFKVNGAAQAAKLTGNIVHSFTSGDPGDRCSGGCSFDHGSSNVTLDSTGPTVLDTRTNTNVPSWSHTELGANWARFSPGYELTQDVLVNEVGSAHVIAFKNPTSVAEIPTGGTAQYNVIRGGTLPTMVFATNGVMQPEVIGTLTGGSVTIDFGTRAMTTSLAGVFVDGSASGNAGGAGLGSFSLAGNGTGSFSTNGGLTAYNLTGAVTSSRISDTAGNTCSAGCGLNGRTDQILIGRIARGIGGAFHANTTPGTTGRAFAVSGTYLLEQSTNLANQAQ